MANITFMKLVWASGTTQFLDMTDKAKGGGVLIAVLRKLKPMLLFSSDTVEAIVIHIGSETTLCCMYLHLGCSEDYFIDALLFLQSLPIIHNLIVTGDFNLPEIDWEYNVQFKRTPNSL